MPVLTDSPDPHYYLRNFQRALAWVDERYDDLLDPAEHAFMHAFDSLPLASQALLVRMLMRKGSLFRASRLVYSEIGCPLEAAQPLVARGFVDPDPLLTLDELFSVCTRPELSSMFSGVAARSSIRKADLLAQLRERHGDARRFALWCTQSSDRVLRVAVTPLCDRLRLMFFGNLHQDWSEFVLADLGVFQYETVAFAPSSRAFQQRADIDVYLALHACREALDGWPDDEPLDALLSSVDACSSANIWLETRRARLLFRIGQHCERLQDWATALTVYERCLWPGARHRRIRVLERGGHFEQAFALAGQAVDAPESDEESQRVARMLPRLQRRVGQAVPRPAGARAIARSVLTLPRPSEPVNVEAVARDYLGCVEAPVHYVENALINSLFGLLCWEPVFAAIPGAFFHPFQRGPADLHAPDFHARRAAQFAACLAQLDSTQYRDTILRHYESKAGLQSPFVFWGLLTPELLTLALDCLPAAHLKRWFERLLMDIRSNRSGLPDLIQFWPAERRYELIEVKGPGDRLQDNQIRWLEYCVEHGMPVRVLDVRWADDARAAAPVGALA
ncbi:VRR-NUC domain-containing protein [Paraburkholderia sp. BL10I2N1]|uniref:VRR-NUC domain-containing protein n=1 Tax=Paraburkholderia sp. BL10I2N1 TaxID=1938796 RepID=UPI0010619824|nr:VRR-NUC domain-containing protein [Paraburkholderia sp. BL10I2N1]TDN69427.1 VRR-NUC domain-containing protein [Paraburkholderia sp. BL10I2N1]